MKLKDYLEKNKISRERLAADFHISYATVCFWISGRSRPNPQHMKQIQEITNNQVTSSDFEEKKLDLKSKESL